MHPPCTPPSPSLSARPGGTGEKRGKESSDEDSGGEKGSPRGDGDEKGPTPDGSSGDDDYRRVRSKRQKLKEKKKRQKARKAEAALRPSLLLFDEEERERLWILDTLKPTLEAVDQALAGHPATHPQLLRLLGGADTLSTDWARTAGIDPASSRPVFRRLLLSPVPFTIEAFHNALDDHLTSLRHGPPPLHTTAPLPPLPRQAAM
jgi:hypothetical protein